MKKFNWMSIGKVGTWTDKHKQQIAIDEKYLDEIIAATKDPKDVKFVIEHPKYDKIGFGNPSALKRVGQLLFALPESVTDDFKLAVNQGELPGRSMTLDKATKQLLNISFLPKEVPPAIPLEQYQFSTANDSQEIITLSFQLTENKSHFAEITDDEKIEFAQYEVSSWPFNSIKNIFRNLKNNWIQNFGVEEADRIFPEYILEETGLAPRVYEKRNEPYNPSFQQTIEGKMDLKNIDLTKLPADQRTAVEALITDLNTQLNAKKVELQTATTNLTVAEKAQTRTEILQFMAGDDVKLKIKPADKEELVNFMSAQKEKGVIEFSTGEGQPAKQLDLYEFSKKLIKAMPDVIELSELAKNGNITAQGMADYQKVGKEIADSVTR